MHVDVVGPRVRAGLERALRDAVQSGRLGPGAQLPSSRSLAFDLGIARNTVADAYSQLVAEGWLTARRGSGTHVAVRAAAVEAVPPAPTSGVSRLRYDLRPGSPDLSSFPRRDWLAAASRAVNTAPDEALGYPDPLGRPELRAALAGYLTRARGVRVTPDRIVVSSGFAHGLGLLCTALRARGAATLAIEGYGQPSHRALAAASGLELTTVPVDADGAVVAAFGDADAVLLTPAHQFPLGVALAASRRTRAVEWALDHAGFVIEDDYDGEFRYDRPSLSAMQALAPEHVVYAGTASKSLAPGLRLGWLALPAGLLDDVVAAKTTADRQNSTIDQLSLAEFIASGRYDRHVRRARLAYRQRRDQLVAALRREAPNVRVNGIAAGLHALLDLPAGQSENETVDRAADHDLAIEGLNSYAAAGQHHSPALIVGYGTPTQPAFVQTVARLCRVLNDDAAGN